MPYEEEREASLERAVREWDELANASVLDSDFVFLDVETPNRKNDRICSIGLVRTNCLGEVVDQDHILVDPEAPFDAFNTNLHGISADDVSEAGTFGEAWPRIKDLAENAVVVAHNANFDLTVLDKCLEAYGISVEPVKYACTLHLASTYIQGLPNYRLSTVCQECGVGIGRHHDAMSDALACRGVFFAIKDLFCDGDELWGEYIPRRHREARRAVSFKARRSSSTEAMAKLKKLCSLIISDGEISTDEITILHWWISGNDDLESRMVDRLLGLLSSMLEDGEFDEAEEAELMTALKEVVDPLSTGRAGGCPIEGKKFCLTGDFDFGSKAQVAATLEAAGGIACKSVIKSCDYVIVGARGSEAYAFGNYGTKVKKAMDLQAKGLSVAIVSEHDFDLFD